MEIVPLVREQGSGEPPVSAFVPLEDAYVLEVKEDHQRGRAVGLLFVPSEDAFAVLFEVFAQDFLDSRAVVPVFGQDPAPRELVVWGTANFAEPPEITLVLRTNDPALHIVAEMSTDLDGWTWLLMRSPVGSWEINESRAELLEWKDLGEGMHKARLQALPESAAFFIRMQVDYVP